MAKRRVRVDRLLIVVLTIILVVLLVILGVKYFFSDKTNNKKEEQTVETETNVKLNLKNSEVYNFDDDLGFGFVVCEIEFVSNQDSLEYDLSNLVTDEGIKLSDAFSYENKLKTTNHDFDSLNTTYIISDDSNLAVKRIFVPYILATKNVVISDMEYNNSLVIDISGEKINIDTLLNKATEEQIVSSAYSFTCSKPYAVDMMKYNGEPFDTSTLSVYVFKLTCDSIKDGVSVTSASFTDNNDVCYDAYDENWSSSKVDNILGKTIKVGDTYGLFFQVYSNEEDKVTYEGKIKLNFSDNTSVEIDTELN